MYKVYGNVLSTGTKERTIEVLGGFGHSRMCVNTIGCGVLATIEQWYPTNSTVWPHLVTIEKTIKYPTSAMCRV